MKQLRVGLLKLFVVTALVAAPLVQAVGAAPLANADDTSGLGTLIDSTRTTDTYQASDGTLTTVAYPGSVNYNDAGTFQPIDDSLVPVPGPDPDFENAANRYDVQLPPNVSDPVQLSRPAGSVTLALLGASASRVVDGDTATYPDAMPGVTVAYASQADQVKETLTLADASAPTSFDYRLTVSDGLTPQANDSGGIDVVNGSGTVVYSIAPPFMTDSSGNLAEILGEVPMTLSQDASGWLVSMAADQAWLSDPARVWPVVIDPTITVAGATQDCYYQSGTSGASQSCVSGNLNVGVNGNGIRRAVLKFSLSSIPTGATVTSATLGLTLTAENKTTQSISVETDNVAQPWTTGVTWTTYDGTNAWATTGGDFTTPTTSLASVGGNVTMPTSYSFDLTQLVQGWVGGSITNNGVLLRQAGDDTATSGNILSFASTESGQPTTARCGIDAMVPCLAVTYTNNPPNVPSNLSTDMRGLEPVLHGVFSDTDGGTGQVLYTVQDSSGAVVLADAPGSQTQSGSDSSFTIDETANLEYAQTYTWTARGWDGLSYSSFSATQSFVFIPVGTTPSPAPYDDLADGSVNNGGAFDLTTMASETPVTSGSGSVVGGGLSDPEDSVPAGQDAGAPACTPLFVSVPDSLTTTGAFSGPNNNGTPAPDPTIAAGPANIVIVLNSGTGGWFYIWNKGMTTEQIESTQTMFHYPDGYEATDPGLVYDQVHARFVASDLAYKSSTKSSRLYFAWSDSSDAFGVWHWRWVDANANDSDPNLWFADFDKLGFNGQGVYATANMYTWPDANGNQTFKYSNLWIFPPDLSHVFKASGIKNPDGHYSVTVEPAWTLGNPGIEYMVDRYSGGWLNVWRVIFSYNSGDPTSSTLTLTPNAVQVAPFSLEATGAAQKPDSNHPTPPLVAFGGTGGLTGASWWSGHLWTSHTVSFLDYDNKQRTQVRVYNVATSANANTKPHQDGCTRFIEEGRFYFDPRITTTKDYHQILTFAFSSSSDWVGIAYVQRVNGLWGTVRRLKSGTGVVPGGSSPARFGDYFAAAPDSDGTTDWILGEYADGTDTHGATYGTHF